MNTVVLSGRMTKDPELKYTSGGKANVRFTLAVQRTKDEADFVNCVAWEKTAENIAEYFGKGNRILIQGRLSVNSYEQNGEKRKFTRVLVNTFEFIDSKNRGDSQNNSRNRYDSDEDEGFPF